MIPAAGPPPRYRVLETIGKGGMGEVCLAHDVVLDRRVALKFLSPVAAASGDGISHLLREARAAAALDHPFICKIFEVTDLDSRPCIVMEYVAGETLDRKLRRGPLPLALTLRLGEEIADAIEAAHNRRFVHRDLKPSNLIVTESDHIKVMDFGLATRLPATAAPAQAGITREMIGRVILLGTPAYMSPEQVLGRALDRRTDIFSLGVVLYEVLSGVHPFRRSGLDATLAAILQEAPADLHDLNTVPRPVAAVVAKMLAKDPAARYQAFGDIRLDLRRVSAELAAPGTADTGPVIIESPLGASRSDVIGRDSERSDLLGRVRQVVAGRGGLVLLAGDAGIGKTRLAEEALTEARRLGCLTLVGRCYEQEGMPPLMPYVEAIEQAAQLLAPSTFRSVIGRTAPELARLVPDLHRLVPDMPAPLDLPPELRQRYLFNNIREFVTRLSRVRPVVLFLDDLHWADEPTLQLTQQLAPHLESMTVVIIGAYRERDTARAPVVASPLGRLLSRVRGHAGTSRVAAHALTRVVEQLVGQRLARLLPLGPLSEAGVASMLSALAQKEAPPRLGRKFVDDTGGNPFFVEELFRYLKDEGRLFDEHGQWRSEVELEEIDVPAGIRVLIGRRLQRLTKKTHAILVAAAAIGRHFDLDLLEAVSDAGGDAVAAALDEGEQAQLIRGPSGRQERRWRFAHQLIRQTLTASMPGVTRQRLHLRIADAMARLDGRGSHTFTAEIAHHLYRAGPLADARQTARALMAAGQSAAEVYATDEAIQHYRRATDILQEAGGDPGPLLTAQERLADLLALTGKRKAAMEHYERVAGAAHDPARRARAIRKMGTLHWQAGSRQQAGDCFERALAAVEGQAADLERAHVYHEIGLAAFRNGDSARAIEWCERALTAARAALTATSDEAVDVRRTAMAAIAHATNTIGVALARAGQLEAARDRIEHSVAAANEHGLLDVACRGYANLGVLYSTVEPRRAVEVSETGLELARRIGASSLQSHLYANLAAAYCALTDRCETEGLVAARTAADLDRQLGQLDHLPIPLIVIAQIHQCQGELQQAQDAYLEALRIAEKVGEPQLLFPCYDGLATIHLDRGDSKRAEEYLEKARALCEQAGLDPDTLVVLPFLS